MRILQKGQVFAELDVLGGVLLALSCLIALAQLAKVSGRGGSASAAPGPRAALNARALCVSVAANLAAGFFLSYAYDTVLWIVIVICAALVRIAEASPVGGPLAAAPT